MTIAVLSSNHRATMQWLLSKCPSGEYYESSGKVVSGDTSYFIVERNDQVRGIEYDCYIISPSYWTLEDEVRLRIR